MDASSSPINSIKTLESKKRECDTIQHKITFRDQSSKSSWVLSFSRKLSPSALSFWPSTWLSHPLPRTASTRRMYASSWRSICLAQMMEPASAGKSLTRLMWHARLCGYCTCNAKQRKPECTFGRDANRHWVSEEGLTSTLKHYRSFRRRVFPVSHLHLYWHPNKNNQETEHTNNTVQNGSL